MNKRAVTVSVVLALMTVAVSCAQSTLPGSQTSVPAQPAKNNETPAAAQRGKSPATTDVNSAEAKNGPGADEKTDFPAIVPSRRPVLGLALEGGGALGLAHIGVLKWLEENRIPVDRISGTSMGALVGALYASGDTAKQIQEVAESSAFQKLFYIRTPYNELNYRRREDEHDFPQTLTLGLKGGPSFRNALISDDGLNDFLNQKLFRYDSAHLQFNALPIPFRSVATDLSSMEPVVFDGGPLPLAIRASISIPGVFSPVQYHDHYLVDGAVVDNLPTDIVKHDLHADEVIGIHLITAQFKDADVSSIFGVFSRAASVSTSRNEKAARQFADTMIDVDTSQFTSNDYSKADLLIQKGYEAASRSAAALRRYALSEDDWRRHLEDRSSRLRPQPGLLQAVNVEGSTPGARADAALDFRGLKNRPLSDASLTEALHRVRGNGTNQATYETFQPGQPANSPVDIPRETKSDTGVTVRLSPVRRGPPFLQFGIDTTAANSNVARSTLDFRLLNTDFGGFGSELRTDIRLGFLTEVSTSYYRLLSHSGYFLEPQLGLERRPVYLWRNQHRISEHLQQQAGGSLQAGRTFNRNAQFAFEYENQVVRWHPVLGSDGTSPVSGTAQTATAHLTFDNTLSGIFAANKGIHDVRVELRAGAIFHSVASENAPFLQASIRKPFRLNDQQALLLSVDANSYARRNVSEPLRFTMGGPLRLSASSIEEYRGTDNYLMRGAYIHRISSLPAGYGQGLYGAFAYEAAEIWSPERPATLRQDGALSIIGVLPIGALTVGGAVGDASHRKIFFTFGRLF